MKRQDGGLRLRLQPARLRAGRGRPLHCCRCPRYSDTMPFNNRRDPMADTTIPPDDASRKLTLADPNDPKMRHISVAGGTYTILVSGEQTGGRYSLIDMLVPPGGGPPPHRHDFEEMCTNLGG